MAENQNIANAFYKAGFIESWGRGIDKIRTDMQSAGLPEPVFEETCGGMMVTINRGKTFSDTIGDKQNFAKDGSLVKNNTNGVISIKEARTYNS